METKPSMIYGGAAPDAAAVAAAVAQPAPPAAVAGMEFEKPKTISDIVYEIVKTIGIATLASPQIIKDAGIAEIIDWRFKQDNCPEKIENKNDMIDPDDAVPQFVEKAGIAFDLAGDVLSTVT